MYNEIRYSIPVLAGAVPEVEEVEVEAGFVEVEVTSVVDGFIEVVELLVDEALVEQGFDVSTPGMHWPRIRQHGKCRCFQVDEL
jgi:hypothetical protein